MSIRSVRAKAKHELGHLAAAFTAAMRIWDADKLDGVSFMERLARLERTLRAAWPQIREWKYLCDECFDLGLVYARCPGDATCGRHRVHLPHDFGSPCWCALGVRFREKPKPTKDDFTAAGKSKPMTRVGR